MTGHLPEPPVMFASDLDRTLIYSANSMLLQGEDHEAPPMVVAEVYNGSPLTYMTRRAASLLTEIAGAGVFVPVTTRTQAQFGRVQLPGRGQGYAVTTNGAVLLHDGEIDQSWRRQIQRSLQGGSAPFEEIRRRLTRLTAAQGVLRVHSAEDVFVYAIVDRANLAVEDLQELTQWCKVRGWNTSLQGRKLYCVPDSVSKEGAVAEIRRRTGARTLVTAGDSLLDAGLLEAGDVAFRPAHGELAESEFVTPNLRVTSSVGLLAGEEILRKFAFILQQSSVAPRAATV
ncbi:HAD family hydrolase [Paenarthrobacter sp. UW852]|uniref:HAD family hydrolase n=1 Tax=Paenarthrobacter sp. UW852 TaxID=2951989 RepID=UPI002147E0DF|nr:HAD family hydrolase [Paenarthrobacter sp. UW852]MCR1161667.1 HAD family hydrolase [Paenarthrobacter sp. UW852]